MFSALEIFLVMRYINLLFTYLLTYWPLAGVKAGCVHLCPVTGNTV